jgi:hypothetical protein
MNSRVLICLVVLVACAAISNADDLTDEEQQPEPPKNADEFAALYKKMLVKKRKQQQDAVKRMVQMSETSKEKDVVGLVMKKIFETTVTALENLAKLTKRKNELRFDKDTINGI